MPVFARVRRFKWPILLVMLILLASALFGYDTLQQSRYQRTDNAYVKADVVWITAPISGELTALTVQEQQQVEQGAVVAVIEDVEERTNRDSQLNALTALKAAALDIHQQTESAQLNVVEGLRIEQRIAQQTLSQLSQTQQRQALLLQAGLVSSQSVEAIKSQLDATAARIGSLNASIQAAERQQQSLLNRRAQLEQELQLARKTAAAVPISSQQAQVSASMTGRVSSLGVPRGSQVNQGARLMAITAPESLYIEAWFDEPQLEHMQLGQRVSIQLDAYPSNSLQGHITQLRSDQPLPPLQNSRVRRLPIRIALDRSVDDFGKTTASTAFLRAGLAASVEVDLRHPLRDWSPKMQDHSVD